MQNCPVFDDAVILYFDFFVSHSFYCVLVIWTSRMLIKLYIHLSKYFIFLNCLDHIFILDANSLSFS